MRMKKFFIVGIILCLLLSLSSCGSSSKFVGNWVCAEEHPGYPAQIIIKADGTGSFEGFPCSWTENDGKLIFNVGNAFIGTWKYDYKFSGSKLYLDDYSYTKK